MPQKQKRSSHASERDVRVRKLTVKHKKKVAKSKKVAGSVRLFESALKHLWQNKKLFGGILLVYALLYFLLVKGLATNFHLSETRDALKETLGGDAGGVETAAALFGDLVGTAGNVSGEAAGVYQSVLFVLLSLVIIWSLRQTFDGRSKVTVKAAFYQSMSQLIPYILVGLVIIAQLIPALIGIMIYGVVVANGIAVSVIEQVLWFLVLIIAMGASVYFISSSIFASYIVTLPGMTPLAALRSARSLVRLRRWMIVRKLVFLPLVVLLIMAVLFMPLVLYATVVAEVAFLIFTLLLLLFVHAYFYVLYRELL